ARLVVEPPRPLRLVVSLDHRVGLGEELPQARRALRLAVRQVVDDLGGGPLAGERSRRQLARRKSLERLHDLGVAGLVLRDERVARVRVHVGLLSHTGALAHPGSVSAAVARGLAGRPDAAPSAGPRTGALPLTCRMPDATTYRLSACLGPRSLLAYGPSAPRPVPSARLACERTGIQEVRHPCPASSACPSSSCW